MPGLLGVRRRFNGGPGFFPAWGGGGWQQTGSRVFGVEGDLSGLFGSLRWYSAVPGQGVLLSRSQALWGQRIQFRKVLGL